jgi:hypothetical protein
METTVTQNICNVCHLPFVGGENGCVGHQGLIASMWNANPEYQDYQNFLINKKRQQAGMSPLEFNFSKKNRFQDNH